MANRMSSPTEYRKNSILPNGQNSVSSGLSPNPPATGGIVIPRLLALEDRVLYSAAPLGPDAAPEVSTALEASWILPIDPDLSWQPVMAESDPLLPPVPELAENLDSPSSGHSELDRPDILVVIDGRLDDIDRLLVEIDEQLEQPFEWLRLGPEEDGWQALNRELAKREGIRQLHLVTHAAAGELYLGATALDLVTPTGQNNLESWQQALSVDADILLYGCNLAEGAAGRSWVDQLARLTGADVAASQDATGNGPAADWDLEYRVGTLESTLLFSQGDVDGWDGILASPVLANAGDQELSARDRGSTRAVAMDDDGTFVVVWSDDAADGDGWAIVGQRFNAHGGKVGSQFVVNQTTLDDQQWASIAMAADGTFVVSWTSDSQDGDNAGVFARRFSKNAQALTNEFQVNQYTTGDQFNSVVDMSSSGGFVIVWEGQSAAASHGISARRFDSAGNALGNQFDVSPLDGWDHLDPALSVNGNGEFVVSWDDANGFHFQRFDNLGVASGGVLTVDGSSSAGNGAVLLNNDRSLAVTWRETTLGLTSIWMSLYDENNVAIVSGDSVSPISLFDHMNPSIDGSGDGSFGITWEANSLADGREIYTRQYQAGGIPLGVASVVNSYHSGDQTMASIAYQDDGHFVIAWSGQTANDANDIGIELDISGLPQGTDALWVMTEDLGRVLQETDFGYSSPTGATFTRVRFENIPLGTLLLDGVRLENGAEVTLAQIQAGRLTFVPPSQFAGNLVNAIEFRVGDVEYWSGYSNFLTFQVNAQADAANLVAGQSLTLAGVPSIVNSTRIGDQAVADQVLLRGGQQVWVWQSTDGNPSDGDEGNKVYLQLFSPLGVRLGTEFRIAPLAVNEQYAPKVAALADGGFLVVWEGMLGASTEIYAQRFDALGNFVQLDGTPAGVSNPVQINQHGVGNQFDVDVLGLDAGGFVISWATRDTAIATEVSAAVVARFYDSNGNGSDEQLINQFDVGNQRSSAWAQLSNGDVIATWVNQNGTGFDIQARIMQLGDPTSGSEFTVNQSLAGRQADPRVVDLGGNQLVIVWASDTLDGSGSGVAGRRFDYSGTPLDAADVQLSQTSVGDQLDPELLALRDGTFLVVWSSDAADGDGMGVVARRFDAAWGALSDEIVLSRPAAGDQTEPRIMLLGDGSIAVSWLTDRASLGASGSDHDIVQARYVFAASGPEETAIPISLSIGNLDTDSSQTLQSVVLSGVPSGYTVADGVRTFLGDGVANVNLIGWTLSNLTITPPDNCNDSITLTVSITVDDNGQTVTTTSNLLLRVSALNDAPQHGDWTDSIGENGVLNWNGNVWFDDLNDPDELTVGDPITAAWASYGLPAGSVFLPNGQNQLVWNSQNIGPSILLDASKVSFQSVLAPSWGDIGSSFQFGAAGGGTVDLSSWVSTQVAFEFWVRPDNLTQNGVIFEWGGAADGFALYQVGETIQFVVNQGNSVLGFPSTAITLVGQGLSVGDFNQIVAVWDGAGTSAGDLRPDVALYLNGQLLDFAVDLADITGISPADFNNGLPVVDERIAGLGNAYGSAVEYQGFYTPYAGEIAAVGLFDQTLDLNEINRRYFDVANRITLAEIDGQAVSPGSAVTLSSGAVVTYLADGTFQYDANGQFDSLRAGQSIVDTFNYRINDSQGGSELILLSVTVNGSNDEQILTVNQGLTVTEGSSNNLIGTAQLQTTDADHGPSELVYTVTALPAFGNLRLNGVNLAVGATFTQADIDSGKLSYHHSGVESASDSFGFVVDDGTGASTAATFALTIQGVNESAPTITSDGGGNLANLTLSENSNRVTTVQASDADLPAQTLTYSITGGADAARFSINALTGELSLIASPDFENPTDANRDNLYLVVVTVTDGQFSDRQGLRIQVTDVDEFDVSPIDDKDATGNSISEKSDDGDYVGLTASAFDSDGSNNEITYSLDDDAGGRFAIDSKTGEVTVANAALLDAETALAHNIVVRASSADGSSVTRTFKISVEDLDEFDLGPLSDSNMSANRVAENAVAGTVVGLTANATDGDATNSKVTYSLLDDAGGRFVINATTGVVTVANGVLLDRETAGDHAITVQALSQDGSVSTAVFLIAIDDVDEFDVTGPVDTQAAPNQVNENAAAGTAVGIVVSAGDSDFSNNQITYSLLNDAGGRFQIHASTGVVTVANGGLLNHEASSSETIIVQATSADGSSSTQLFVIGVLDVVESPQAANDTFTVNEGGTFQSPAGWLGSNDTFFDQTAYTFTVLRAPKFGGVQIASDGTIRYIHGGGEQTSDSLIYRVRGANGGWDSATVNITVIPVDDAPTAVDDAGLFTFSGQSLLLPPSQLKGNDFDPDSALNGITIGTGPAVGQLIRLADGQLQYSAPEEFFGTVSFTYTVSSAGQASNFATVTIDVLPSVSGGSGSGAGSGGSGGGSSPPPVIESGDSGGTESPGNPSPGNEGQTPEVPVTGPIASSGSTSSGNSNSTQDDEEGPLLVDSRGDAFADLLNQRAGNLEVNSQTGTTGSTSDLLNLARVSTTQSLQLTSEGIVGTRMFASAQLIQEQIASSAQFAEYLNRVESELEQGADVIGFEMPTFAPAAASLFTVGYVAWLIRGGVLLTSFMSSLPSWQSFDPLPILESANRGGDESEDGAGRDSSIAEMVDSEQELETT